MDGIIYHEIMQNLVTSEKYLNLNDQLKKLSVQKKIFFQRKLDNIMKDEYPALNYCMKLMGRGPNAFIQFIDIPIETKQNIIVDSRLNTSLEIQ